MSLIVTHKGYLAVDSIRYGTTRKDENGTTQKHRRVIDNNVNKLVLPEGEVEFRDQRLLAVARCGNVALTKHLVQDVLKGRDLGKEHTRRCLTGKLKTHWAGRLVILTDTSSWVVIANARKRSLEVKELHDEPYAAGNGARIAMYFMKHLNLKAIDALNASMLDRSSEGNRVRYVNRKRDGTLTKRRIYTQDPSRTKLKVAQHLLELVHDSHFGKTS